MDRPELVRGPRERYFERDGGYGSDSRSLFWFALVVSTFLFVLTLSAWQASDRERALNLIEPAIASTTDIDLLLAENLGDLRERAREDDADIITLPGYAIEVPISDAELDAYSDEQVRRLLIERSAERVYDDGLGALEGPDGGQSVSMFSLEGSLRFVLGRVDSGTHTVSQWAMIVLLAVGIVAGGGVVLSNTGLRRFQLLGAAVLAGAIPVMMIAILLTYWAGRGSGDPYISDLREILEAYFAVYRRNAIVIVAFAAIVTASGPLLSAIERKAHPEYGDAPDEVEMVRGPRR